MTQGDTFFEGEKRTVNANSTDIFFFTAASGESVAVHSMVLGIGDNVGTSSIAPVDTSPDPNVTLLADADSAAGAWLTESSVNSTAIFQQSKVFIDDRFGLAVQLDNTGCSSVTQTYSLSGQVVKS